MLRQTTAQAFGTIFVLAALVLSIGGQSKKEIDPALVSRLTLTATAQNQGSPCQSKPELVCLKVNWTVESASPVNKVADFKVIVDATNGNPASKNKDTAQVPGSVHTVTLKLPPAGSTFKVRVIARNSAQQPLASVDTTGNF